VQNYSGRMRQILVGLENESPDRNESPGLPL